MTTIHNLGFPRIGKQRELKFALESYWKGASTRQDLLNIASNLRKEIWNHQSELDLVPVGDFSFYDQVLDMSFTLGNLPERVQGFHGEELDNYFRVARGRSVNSDVNEEVEHQSCCNHQVTAAEMTKWFDTNYHYIVPEFTADTKFELNTNRLLEQLEQAKKQGVNSKPVIVGPVTYLALGKAKDNSDKLLLLEKIIPTYVELLNFFAKQGIEWVQIDEPILVTELEPQWQQAFKTAYNHFNNIPVKLLLTTYFGELLENRELVTKLPVSGIHVDAVLGSQNDVNELIKLLPSETVLSIGVINGRNIWKTDLNKILDWLEPISEKLGDKLWIAPSCSLLHVPVDLNSEVKLDSEIKSWLAFAIQKLEELNTLGKALNNDRASVQEQLLDNAKDIKSRLESSRVNNVEVQKAIKAITPELGKRDNDYQQRAIKQKGILNLPLFPTTTIGSFPQTADIRRIRRDFKAGKIEFTEYQQAMHEEIQYCVEQQEKLGLDVLVHGEAERNDMVEYFGEQLEGYVFSEFAWVQSYGSRCVKPPILFGDISRPKAMTVEWIKYAQTQTKKPMKGMLTGPVTILNWSFVRDDQPRSTTCKQLALAIREEVLDLEKAGIRIIQIDEAALREGLPLRKSQWQEYLDWAIESFRITANGVQDETQIHTHMCYSEFNDIINAIADMDADVITIETSRSDMELLDAFEDFHYPNEIGPGVYDIHSPNITSKEHMVDLIKKASTRIPAERLWLNPDCGLKTRQWEEVIPALQNLVNAANELR